MRIAARCRHCDALVHLEADDACPAQWRAVLARAVACDQCRNRKQADAQPALTGITEEGEGIVGNLQIVEGVPNG